MHMIISDAHLAEKLSRNCKRIVEFEFSLKKIVDRLEQVYKEVVEVSLARDHNRDSAYLTAYINLKKPPKI